MVQTYISTDTAAVCKNFSLLETGVQSLVESYQRIKKKALDLYLLNTHHHNV